MKPFPPETCCVCGKETDNSYSTRIGQNYSMAYCSKECRERCTCGFGYPLEIKRSFVHQPTCKIWAESAPK